MRRPVFWSRAALDDLKSQIAFIASEKPLAARAIAERVREAAGALGGMATGRPGRVSGTYEKPIPRLPYILAYQIDTASETIVILRVIHAARNWRAGKWPE